jgi:leucine dehydrogenase
MFGEPSLANRRILVQGIGSVGANLIEHLRRSGAHISISDTDSRRTSPYEDDSQIHIVSPDDVYSYPCDVFAPCAVGGILNRDTIPQLECKIVAGGANNQLAEFSDAARLHSRNILFIPDYVISVGAVMAIPRIELHGVSQRDAEIQVSTTISDTLRKVLTLADHENITPEEAARQIGDENLSH